MAIALSAASDGHKICQGRKPVALDFKNGIPSISIQIGGEDVTAKIDTGSPVSLASDRLIEFENDDENVIGLESYYGDFQAQEGTIKGISIGNCSVTEVSMFSIITGAEEIVDLVDEGVILGRDFLDAFDIILDGPRSVAFIRNAKSPKDRTDFAYAVEYQIGEDANICLFDTGFSADETMFIHQDAPILDSQNLFQPLDIVKHGASKSGLAQRVSIFGRLGNNPVRSFIAAIEQASDPIDKSTGLGYCIVGSEVLKTHRVILRSDQRLVGIKSNN
ncbi:MAG: hypothetical protein AAF296_06615 [Pseudomonadota bacterium]